MWREKVLTLITEQPHIRVKEQQEITIILEYLYITCKSILCL